MVIQSYENQERKLLAEVHSSEYSDWLQVILYDLSIKPKHIIKRESKYWREGAFQLAMEWVGIKPAEEVEQEADPTTAEDIAPPIPPIKSILGKSIIFVVGDKVYSDGNNYTITAIKQKPCNFTNCFEIHSEVGIIQEVFEKDITISYV